MNSVFKIMYPILLWGLTFSAPRRTRYANKFYYNCLVNYQSVLVMAIKFHGIFLKSISFEINDASSTPFLDSNQLILVIESLQGHLPVVPSCYELFGRGHGWIIFSVESNIHQYLSTAHHGHIQYSVYIILQLYTIFTCYRYIIVNYIVQISPVFQKYHLIGIYAVYRVFIVL